jgi:hypothetical protein
MRVHVASEEARWLAAGCWEMQQNVLEGCGQAQRGDSGPACGTDASSEALPTQGTLVSSVNAGQLPSSHYGSTGAAAAKFRAQSTCMNSVQLGIMPCATFRTVPFQIQTHTISQAVAYSDAKCFSAKRQHRQWKCLTEKASFSGSCSRCLIFSLLPCPALKK